MTRVGSLVLTLLLTGPVAGQDAWLEPLTPRPKAHSRIGIRLFVGSSKQKRVRRRHPPRTERFVVAGSAGRVKVAGRGGDDPAGMARVEGAGVYAVGYQTLPAWIRSPAPRFEAHLRYHGLDEVATERRLTNATHRDGVEIYARCAKTLLVVGKPRAATGFDRRVGLELELVPEVNPWALRAGPDGKLEPLPIRAYFRGRPLSGLRLRARGLDQQAGGVVTTTDKQGRARLRLPGPGRWLIAGVHMVAADEFAEWASTWTTLSLEAPAEPPPANVVFAQALVAARKSGAIKRLLGRHHFRFDRTFHGPDGKPDGRVTRTLMTYDLIDDPQARTFTVEVDVSPFGQPHGIRFRYVLGWDGRLQAFEGLHGSKIVVTKGVMAISRGGQPTSQRAYDDAILPKVVGVFTLPMLFDQRLPRVIKLRDLDPFGRIGRPMSLRPIAPGESGALTGHRTFVTDEGRSVPTTRIRVLADGPRKGLIQQIWTRSVVYGPSGEEQVGSIAQSDRLTPAEYQALWKKHM